MSLSYEQTMAYRYDKQQQSNIVMIAVSSVGIALGLVLLAGSIKRSVSGTSTTAWRLLAPTALLLAGSFAAPLAAGVKSIQLDKSQGWESYRDFSTYAAAAVVTGNLFSIMLLVTGRVAFWEVAQVTQLLRTHKATKITLLIIDCILLAAGVGSMLAMTHRAAEYGACIEHGCLYSTHIGIVALDNAMFGFGFPVILMIAIAHLMISGPAAYGLFAKRAGITSPLLNRLNKVVVPAFGIYLVTAIVFVAVAGSIGGDSYELWTMYYVSIPYLLTQAIVMFALQNALRGYPMQASLDVPLSTKAAEA